MEQQRDKFPRSSEIERVSIDPGDSQFKVLTGYMQSYLAYILNTNICIKLVKENNSQVV